MGTPITEIAGYPYPDPLSHFRANCRNYEINQYWLKVLEKSLQEQNCREDLIFDYASHSFRSIPEFMSRYAVLKQNVESVQGILENVKMFYGEEAEEMLRESYITGKSRKEVARKYHLSENALQRKYRSWLENVIYEKRQES